MPLYDFYCEKCKTITEQLSKPDAPAPNCATCEKPMTKILSRPAFRFANGTGTDMGNTMSIANKKPQP